VQIVYLSARPDLLRGTLAAVRAHLPFIDDVVVVVPRRLRAVFEELGVIVLDDEQVLGSAGPTNHTLRNTTLRMALPARDEVADVFVMSDDDYRPLRALDADVFLDGDRHRRYWFGWLDEWQHRATTFDAGQHASRQLLALLGHPRRSYAAHMPQVVAKAMLAEVAAIVAPALARHPLCEWSTYFNIAPALHPERFAEPEPYLTLGWPENPAAWQPTLEPGGFAFENHFPEHHGPGAVFDGIDPDDRSLEAAIDKVVRWREYELALLVGEREPTIGAAPEPGSVGRALRRARAALVGDPVQRARDERAAAAALLRDLRRDA
jgi:hypothetical protein